MSRKCLARASLRKFSTRHAWASNAERVRAHVDITAGGCWEWQGSLSADGYGKIMVAGKTWRAHRFSYESFVGPISDDQLVLHRCDNPPCVNPDHLYLGDQMRNERDKVERGRSPAGEKNVKAKLTKRQVDEMRSLYATGKYNKAEIGRLFGVEKSTSTRVINNQLWGN